MQESISLAATVDGETSTDEEGNSRLAEDHLPAIGMRHHFKRFTKFLFVGWANAIVDLAVLNALILVAPTRSALGLFVYNTTAVLCAVVNSYIWNRKWTFSDTATGSRREKVLFLIQAAINVAVNDVVMVWLSTYLVFSRSVPLFVSSNASKGLAMVISSSFSYLCMRLFVFRGKRAPRA